MFRRTHKLLMLFYSMSNPVENVVDQLEKVIDKIVNKKGEVGVLHVVDQLTQVIQNIQNKSEGHDDSKTSLGKQATSVGKSASSSQQAQSVGKPTSSSQQAQSVGKPTSSDGKDATSVGPGEVVIITSRTTNSIDELKKDGKVGDPEIINRESIQLP